MQKTILSTADVARLFHVTETTVKRWADEGLLKCQKTPGGHRKFEMRHVVEFATDNNFEPVGTLQLDEEGGSATAMQVAMLNRDYPVLQKEFVERALSADKADLFQFLSYLYQHRIQLWEVFDHILAPAMYDIGERWARGEIDISHEHRASYETLDSLAKLQAQIRIKTRVPYSVVCACPEEELHEIGLRFAAYIFESEGWRAHYLGARIPFESILAAVQELKPTVLCLSVTVPHNLAHVKGKLAELYAEVHARGVTVVLRKGVMVPKAGDAPMSDRQLGSAKELLDFMHEVQRDTAVNRVGIPKDKIG